MPDPRWDSLSSSEKLRNAYEQLVETFPTNPYKYGVLKAYGESGGKQVYTVQFREQGDDPEDAWPALLSKHLRTEDVGRLGYLPGGRAGTIVGSIDIDRQAFPGGRFEEVVQSVIDAALAENLTPLIETSTSGGTHVWIWSSGAVPYEVMRDALRWIVHKSGAGVLETYPMGSGAGQGRWIFIPYAGALLEEEGKGRTFLQTVDGEAVPIWSLRSAVAKAKNSKSLILQLAGKYGSHQEKFLESGEGDPAKDLDEQSLEQLREAASNPPDGFDRHHSVFAFVNVAERAGAGREMLEFLQSQDIYEKWVLGRPGERSPQEWRSELERIWTAVEHASAVDTQRYGLKFLSDMGWDVPDLARKVESLSPVQGWTKAVDDDISARWLSAQLLAAGKPLAMESGTPFLKTGNTWVPLAGMEDAVSHAVETVLRPSGARIKQEQTRNRISWMLRHVVHRKLSEELSPHHMAVANGMLDLKTGKLVPADPDIVTIGRSPVEWGELTEERVAELLKPLREFLHNAMFFDNVLSPSVKKILVEDFFRSWAWAIDPGKRGRFFLDFHGPTSTGKSTAVRAALMVLGDAGAGDPHGLWTSMDSDSLDLQEFTTALIGRQGVHFDDLGLTGDRRVDRRVVNFFKKVAGGTTVTINRKFQPTVQALVQSRVVISTNTIISGGTSEDTAALNMRAWRLGFFGKSVSRDAQRPEFEKVLLPTEEHRLALLREIVRYWQEFDRSEGRRPRESSEIQRRIFSDWERSDYSETMFVQARCAPGTPDDIVSTSELTEVYNDWARRNNERQHDTRTMGSAMAKVVRFLNARGWEMDRVTFRQGGQTVRGWAGIRFQNSPIMDIEWDDEGDM